MTDPQTPTTEPGRRHAKTFPSHLPAILAIEAEARASLDVDVLARVVAAWWHTPMSLSAKEAAEWITGRYRAILAEQKP